MSQAANRIFTGGSPLAYLERPDQENTVEMTRGGQVLNEQEASRLGTPPTLRVAAASLAA